VTADFTLCFPLHDGDLKHLKKTLPAALALNPSEIVIGVDKPASEAIQELASKHEKIRLVEVEKGAGWNMQLAKVDYAIVSAAKHDRIFYMNADVILNKNILLAIDDIGRDGTACISFTKKLLRKTPMDYIRFHYYAEGIKTEPMPFAGIYWIWKPAYLDLIDPDKYRLIYNGIDNFLTEAIFKSNGKYRLVCRKEFGCDCLTYESGDLKWRQYQVGMWYGANIETQYPEKKTFWGAILRTTWKKQHPYLLFGTIFAVRNPDNESVKLARSMSLVDWCQLGSKHVPMASMKGTGVLTQTKQS
jgi:hypothetical protein